MLAVAEKLDRPWRARQYNANTGAFLSQNPSGYSSGDGPNYYTRTRNNPLRYVDYDGRKSQAPEGGGGYSCAEVAARAYVACSAGVLSALALVESSAVPGCAACGPGAVTCAGVVTTAVGVQGIVGATGCTIIQQSAFKACQQSRNIPITNEFQFGSPNYLDILFNL